MGKRESGIQTNTVNRLRLEFPGSVWRVRHGTAFSVVGDPDIDGCVEGRFAALEVKNEDGELTKIQKYRLKEFSKAGAICGAIRDPNEAVGIIKKGLRQ